MQKDVSNMKQLSLQSYSTLSKHNMPSYYKLCAISHAAGILDNRKKSLKRGLQPRIPFVQRPMLTTYFGFKVDFDKGVLRIPLGDRQHYDIPLNQYVRRTLSSDPSLKIRSFTLTVSTLSICYSKEAEVPEPILVDGVDRNLRNLTIGHHQRIIQYDLSRAVKITENTRSITRSFKRNDVRIRRRLSRKYGQRKKSRVNQLLHRLSRAVVCRAKETKAALAFEDIRHIRRLYQKGNGQGKQYRSRMNNGWSFATVQRQIQYKAAWKGVAVIQLSVKETRGTSQLCPQCGKKITQADRRTRQLWCGQCKKWTDRDVAAAINLSIKGLARFASSKGLAGEAVKGNPTIPVILRVDASKLSFRKES